MRGLKLINPEARKRALVASFTDAWIETAILNNRRFDLESHLLQMRGLKLQGSPSHALEGLSHLLQMRGLKLVMILFCIMLNSRIFYRCVD